MTSEGTSGDFSWSLIAGCMTVPIAVNAAFVCPPTDTAYDKEKVHHLVISQIYADQAVNVKVLLDQWIAHTAFLSSPNAIMESDRFARARQLRGKEFVKDVWLLLDDHPFHAILALSELVPVPFGEELAGDVLGQVNAWKEWGLEHINVENGLTDSVSEFDDDAMGRNEPVRYSL